MKPPVTIYACGHVGRQNFVQTKARGFIRVAEIRGARVEVPTNDHGQEIVKNCPDCNR